MTDSQTTVGRSKLDSAAMTVYLVLASVAVSRITMAPVTVLTGRITVMAILIRNDNWGLMIVGVTRLKRLVHAVAVV